MIPITAEIRAMIDKAASSLTVGEDEYTDPADGLVHCRDCGHPRQAVVEAPFLNRVIFPRCACPCEVEKRQRREEARKRQERLERIKRRRSQGLQARYLYDYTFANDSGESPAMDKIRAYVEGWETARERNVGLLLFGDVGTGKSFAAGCIANALLEQDIPVLMTNFSTILNRLCGTFGEDRLTFLDGLDVYDLLIIDDLGVERSTEYAMEQIYTIIDSRYRSNKPLIVTTNLTLEEMKNPPDLARARIYDRILERCAPVLFAGKNFRKGNAAVTRTAAREIIAQGAGVHPAERKEHP